MRVLHVLAPGEVGGLECVVRMLAQGQAHAGHDVHVATVLGSAPTAHPLLQALAEGGVTTHPIVHPGRAYWLERDAMLGLGRRLRPAVVHTHGYRADVIDAAAARRLGIPAVTTVHGFTGGGWKNRLYERLQRRAHRRFDAVVAVSRPLGEQLIRGGVAPERVHIVRNAWQAASTPLDRVASRRALGWSEDGFLLGWAGRLSKEKGPDVLVDALMRLTDLPVRASLLGSGPEQHALVAGARQRGLERHLRWHGMIPAAARLFPAFDVFVLSSRTEGTPIVLFEAMAAGVPIVATRVGGVPDVVSPAEAVLVAPGDPVALAEGIRSVYQDPAAARCRAHSARARLERDFNVETWLNRYAVIYERVRRRPLEPVLK